MRWMQVGLTLEPRLRQEQEEGREGHWVPPWGEVLGRLRAGSGAPTGSTATGGHLHLAYLLCERMRDSRLM